ncbi:hypothetical protein XENOCAPTIV_010480 [Xenoophorus captivus]|uniref:Uncharacterized protein n=1 Tax=Xenoophorus captivus TaxID=1517983 RepID=A0ABV0QHK9_9TELE
MIGIGMRENCSCFVSKQFLKPWYTLILKPAHSMNQEKKALTAKSTIPGDTSGIAVEHATHKRRAQSLTQPSRVRIPSLETHVACLPPPFLCKSFYNAVTSAG